MGTPANKKELIDESIQDWLHHEGVTLSECIDININVMFLNKKHIPNIANNEVVKLEKQYAEQQI